MENTLRCAIVCGQLFVSCWVVVYVWVDTDVVMVSVLGGVGTSYGRNNIKPLEAVASLLF